MNQVIFTDSSLERDRWPNGFRRSRRPLPASRVTVMRPSLSSVVGRPLSILLLRTCISLKPLPASSKKSPSQEPGWTTSILSPWEIFLQAADLLQRSRLPGDPLLPIATTRSKPRLKNPAGWKHRSGERWNRGKFHHHRYLSGKIPWTGRSIDDLQRYQDLHGCNHG